MFVITILSTQLLVACSSSTSGGAPIPHTQVCPQNAAPQLTTLTPVQSLKQAVYFTYALDAANGNQLWNYVMEGADGSPVANSLSTQHLSATSPVVVKGVVYVGSTFNSSQGTYYTYLHALDAATGKKLWVVPQQPCSGICLGQTPVVEQGRIVIPLDNAIAAFDAKTGHKLWKWSDPGNDLTLLGGANDALYVVEGTTYTNGQPVNHPKMYALDAISGKIRWSVAALDDAVRFHTLATDDTFYVADLGMLYAYDPQNGSIRWHTQITDGLNGAGVQMTGPILYNSELFIGELEDSGFRLHALNAQSGVENWYPTVPGSRILGPMDVTVG